MIWSELETISRNEMEELQLKRLKEQVKYAYDSLEFYRKKMDERHVKADDIKSLEDIKKLPFVYKQDFRDNYPYGTFAVDREEIVRIHASSGTTGKPTVVGYTKKDMDNWIETTQRVAVAGGARPGQIAQNSFGYGMFTGALGLHLALENMDIGVVPISAGNTNRQLMFLEDLQPDILIATPSYALHLSESIVDNGKDPKDFNLKVGLLGGEGLSEKLRKSLNDIWQGQVLWTQNYGMSELDGPGIAGECQYQAGMHVNEDRFFPEIIDPDTEEVLENGEYGELVISCLNKESIPLLRYRTGDITRIIDEPCKCGRTNVRIEPFKGRSDDMLLIRGVNVFPSQIEEIIKEYDEVGSSYEIVVDRVGSSDRLNLKLELEDYSLLESYVDLEDLADRLNRSIREGLGIGVELKFVAPRSLTRFEGKAKRVVDLRDEGDK